MSYLWTDTEWTWTLLNRTYAEIERIGVGELGLDIYPNSLEVISSEQMLDAYSSIGMPVFYKHWSFGKHFTRNKNSYDLGMQGLAYELVINSNPCISYLMEENTMTMMALVMAHACVSGDTEYLSPSGWRRIDQYDGGLVGQYHEDGRAMFVQPSRYIEREQADFIYVKGEKISQAITDDHTVVAINGKDNLIKLSGAELARRQAEKTRGFNCKFITGFKLESASSLPMTDDEIRLHIAIKADGSIVNPDVDNSHWNALPHYRIRFHLKKERKIKRLKDLLTKLAIPFVERPTYEGRVSILFNYGKIDKRFTADWYAASPAQLRVIGEEVCHWDGSLCSHNPSFSSAHKEDADYIQYVWAATNHHAHLNWEKRAYRVTCSDGVGISVSKHGQDGREEPRPFERIPSEDGKAYCFTVDTGMLVIRHCNMISVTGNCIGHNFVFKNNATFKMWTDADSIIDYLVFARDYIAHCEEHEGRAEVERFLDACHALMSYGINHSRRPNKLSPAREKERQKTRDTFAQARVNELFDRLLKPTEKNKEEIFPKEPEENLLYFCEKYAPDLADWKREIIRIVRKISQYFYPQAISKVLNEGAATYTHYRIMNRLHEQGLMTDGAMLEFLISHSNVTFQPDYDDPRYSGINPYALGFAMMRDIARICKEPTDEDRRWFRDIAGSGDEMAVLRDAWANYRDESLIRQYLSPKVIRDLKLFKVKDSRKEEFLKVTTIHNEIGYETMRESLADSYEPYNTQPNIEVIKVEPKTRTLRLMYRPFRNRQLKDNEAKTTMRHMRTLWGDNPVILMDDKGNVLVG